MPETVCSINVLHRWRKTMPNIIYQQVNGRPRISQMGHGVSNPNWEGTNLSFGQFSQRLRENEGTWVESGGVHCTRPDPKSANASSNFANSIVCACPIQCKFKLISVHRQFFHPLFCFSSSSESRIWSRVSKERLC